MIARNKLFIFDMDGTLIDSKRDITASINFVRKQKGLYPLAEDEVAKIVNSDRRLIPKKLYGTKEFEEEDRILFDKHYHIECLKSKPYENIKSLLHNLKDINILLSVATNAPKLFALKMLKNTDLLKYFDLVIGSCDVEKSKPAPDMINFILKKFERFDKKNVIIIGDNYTDIEAGFNAGIRTCFVKWGFGTLNSIKPNFFVSNPDELVKLIEATD
jgi:phosphoglycolate phosphatase